MPDEDQKASLVADLMRFVGKDVNPLVLDDPGLVLATIRQEFQPTVREIDLKILHCRYGKAPHDVQTRVVESLVSLKRLVEDQDRRMADACKGYASLQSVMPPGLVIRLVRTAGGLERLCLKSPSSLKGLKLFGEHPLVKQTVSKERGIRYIACKAVLAARVDFCGDAPVDFSEAIAMHFQRLVQSKAGEKAVSGHLRSHRGGLKHRKRVLKLRRAYRA